RPRPPSPAVHPSRRRRPLCRHAPRLDRPGTPGDLRQGRRADPSRRTDEPQRPGGEDTMTDQPDQPAAPSESTPVCSNHTPETKPPPRCRFCGEVLMAGSECIGCYRRRYVPCYACQGKGTVKKKNGTRGEKVHCERCNGEGFTMLDTPLPERA